MLRPLAFDSLAIASGLCASRQQRAFSGIADYPPFALFLDEMRVVAAEEDVGEFHQRRCVWRVRALPIKTHFALRAIAFTSDFEGLAVDIQCARGHFSDRQRAGLVCADNRSRSERFDC